MVIVNSYVDLPEGNIATEHDHVWFSQFWQVDLQWGVSSYVWTISGGFGISNPHQQRGRKDQNKFGSEKPEWQHGFLVNDWDELA